MGWGQGVTLPGRRVLDATGRGGNHPSPRPTLGGWDVFPGTVFTLDGWLINTDCTAGRLPFALLPQAHGSAPPPCRAGFSQGEQRSLEVISPASQPPVTEVSTPSASTGCSGPRVPRGQPSLSTGQNLGPKADAGAAGNTQAGPPCRGDEVPTGLAPSGTLQEHQLSLSPLWSLILTPGR